MFYEVILKYQLNVVKNFIYTDYDKAKSKFDELERWLDTLSDLDRRYYQLYLKQRDE